MLSIQSGHELRHFIIGGFFQITSILSEITQLEVPFLPTYYFIFSHFSVIAKNSDSLLFLVLSPLIIFALVLFHLLQVISREVRSSCQGKRLEGSQLTLRQVAGKNTSEMVGLAARRSKSQRIVKARARIETNRS